MVNLKGIGRFVFSKTSKFVNNAYIIYTYQRDVELQSFENIFLSLREKESQTFVYKKLKILLNK